MDPIEEIKKCCGTTCDRPAVIDALTNKKYCVVLWTKSAGVKGVSEPLGKLRAIIVARKIMNFYKSEMQDDPVEFERTGDVRRMHHKGVDVVTVSIMRLGA